MRVSVPEFCFDARSSSSDKRPEEGRRVCQLQEHMSPWRGRTETPSPEAAVPPISKQVPVSELLSRLEFLHETV